MTSALPHHAPARGSTEQPAPAPFGAAPVVGMDGRVLQSSTPTVEATTDRDGFYNQAFSEQFVKADPAEVTCSDCLPLAEVAHGIGLEPVAAWIRTASAALASGTISAVHQPQGSPTEDGTIFVECNGCSTRHHTTWKRKGDSTRWLVGKPGGPVFQGRSSYQPSLRFAEDRSRHYREHNAAIIAGEVE